MHFIKLMRPLNLFIIALTMYGLGWYMQSIQENDFQFGIDSLLFFLLVFSTVLIAAAGNIINDYFDVKADRINKPERLIIGTHIKRRVAIITHWGFNLIAFSIAVVLSWKLNTFWYMFIHLLSINVLWIYSSNFKRKFLIGNISIAILTALIPLIVGLFFQQQSGGFSSSVENSFPFENDYGKWFLLFLSSTLAFFAFILNLAREIIKDIEDIEGDKLIHSKSLPIILGIKKSKQIIFYLLLVALIGLFLLSGAIKFSEKIAYTPIILSGFFVLAGLIFILRSNSKSDYKKVNLIVKFAMIFGTLSPVFWKIISLL
jgi:4-hydroxybenzoate polyprenyltransferase